jgi:hypothetical protein
MEIEKNCGNCQWPMPDCEYNRQYYSNLPICGFLYSPKAGRHIEPTDSCKRWTMPFHRQRGLKWIHDPSSNDAQKGEYGDNLCPDKA